MEAEEEAFAFSAPCLLVMPARIAHGFRFDTDSSGWVMTLADSHRVELVRRDADLAALFAAPAVAPLEKDAAAAAAARAETLIRELGWAAPGHRTAIDGALAAILVQALRSVAANSADRAAPRGRHAELVARYRALVEERYRLREPVEVFARTLGVSTTTLRVACARVAGMPPAEILNLRALLEAKRALRYTSLSVAEVAYGLGFADPAYFTRMFTRAVGVAPGRFRRRQGGDGFALPGAADNKAGSMAAH